MSLAILHSRGSLGVFAPAVTVEVHLSIGSPSFSIVGLPETAVRESRFRVRSAIINSRLKFPIKRITVNLAPADLPKEGGRFDLAIALGILAASKQIPTQGLEQYEFVAELALSGELRFVRGLLPVAIATAAAQRDLIIAAEASQEAGAWPMETTIFLAQHLLAVCAHLRDENKLPSLEPRTEHKEPHYSDINEVHGQIVGKRALEIAAAGGHSLLFSGPPGTGKTMLANRLPGILPSMPSKEALEVAAVYSLYEEKIPRPLEERPFRSPHHTISSAGMVGGSYPPHPGEVSLAHRGVLFLDELLEFARPVLESLREPLETGKITIARARYHLQFPAKFQLIAAMNPCPCGYWGDGRGRCQCSTEQIQRYRRRLSGPLLDRIDLCVTTAPIPAAQLLQSQSKEESSPSVRARVTQTRHLQYKRTKKLNAQLDVQDIRTHCLLSHTEQQLLTQAIDHYALSARSTHRILKVARTIADLAESEHIQRPHLAEALGYRLLTPR